MVCSLDSPQPQLSTCVSERWLLEMVMSTDQEGRTSKATAGGPSVWQSRHLTVCSLRMNPQGTRGTGTT